MKLSPEASSLVNLFSEMESTKDIQALKRFVKMIFKTRNMVADLDYFNACEAKKERRKFVRELIDRVKKLESNHLD